MSAPLAGDRTENAELALAQQVAECVFAVARTMRAEMRQALDGEVSMSQVQVLGQVNCRPGLSLGDLARRLGLAAPTVSRLVDDLVERGWLSRERCPSDRRTVAIGLTPAGDEMLAAGRRAGLALLAKQLKALTDDQSEHLREATGLLRALVAEGGQ